MYDNEFETKENKIERRIKLNHNIYILGFQEQSGTVLSILNIQ